MPPTVPVQAEPMIDKATTHKATPEGAPWRGLRNKGRAPNNLDRALIVYL